MKKRKFLFFFRRFRRHLVITVSKAGREPGMREDRGSAKKNPETLSLGFQDLILRKMGLEPTRYEYHKILSLARLPIPTLPHAADFRQRNVFYHYVLLKSTVFFKRVIYVFSDESYIPKNIMDRDIGRECQEQNKACHLHIIQHLLADGFMPDGLDQVRKQLSAVQRRERNQIHDAQIC